MAIKFIDDSILSDIADSIRTKLSSSTTYKPSQMASAISSIQTGTINNQNKTVHPSLSGSINITQNGTVDVTSYASAVVNVPTGVTIDDLATNSQPSGAIVVNTSAIASYSFANKPITSVSAPNATIINASAFAGTPLASASFPSVTEARATILGTSHTFTTIDGNMFPLLETCTISMFNGDTKTTSVTLPSWTGLGYSSVNATNNFRGMTALTTLNLPKCVHVGGYECNGDTKLVSVLLGKTSTYTGNKYIRTHAFDGCTKMNVLVLYGTVTWTLDNINAFTNSPFASGKAGGTLYVPEDMISSYQSASNWSTILGYANNSIVKIEGSIYE